MTFGFLPRSKGNNPFTKYLLAAQNINVLAAAFSLIIEKFTTHTAYDACAGHGYVCLWSQKGCLSVYEHCVVPRVCLGFSSFAFLGETWLKGWLCRARKVDEVLADECSLSSVGMGSLKGNWKTMLLPVTKKGNRNSVKGYYLS